jgi:ceramide glucosyltransferase
MTIWPRDAPFATARAVEAAEDHEMSTWIFAIALACGSWYFFILVVQAIGFTQLWVKRQFFR